MGGKKRAGGGDAFTDGTAGQEVAHFGKGLDGSGGAAGNPEGDGGVERDGVGESFRSGPGEEGLGGGEVLGEVAAAERVEGGSGQAEPLGGPDGVGVGASSKTVHAGIGGSGELVHAATVGEASMHGEAGGVTEAAEGLGQRCGPGLGEDADQRMGGAAGVDEGAEHVEDRAAALGGEQFAGGGDVFERGVKGRGEEEDVAELIKGLAEDRWRRVEAKSQAGEQVGAAALGGDAAIAVFHHRHAGGGEDEGDQAGDVKGAGMVAAGADHIDGMGRKLAEAGVEGAFPKSGGEGGDLGRRLALFGERAQKVGLHGVAGGVGGFGEVVGGGGDMDGGEVGALAEAFGEVGEEAHAGRIRPGHGRRQSIISTSPATAWPDAVVRHSSLLLRVLMLIGLMAGSVRAESASVSVPGDQVPVPSVLDAVVLGLVEGITEFLPVSSTGHLIIATKWLGLESEALVSVAGREAKTITFTAAADAYIVIIQIGAIAAVALLYWRRVRDIVLGLVGLNPAGFRLGMRVLVACLPPAVLGLALGDWIDAHLFSVGAVAFALAWGALLMFWVEKKRRATAAATEAEADRPTLETLTVRQALLVGAMQCLALWPGTSRSMVTIVGGYLAGLKPALAAEFSFLVGLPLLSAAALLKGYKHGPEVLVAFGAGPVVVGLVVAAVSAALAVKLFVSFLTRRGLAPFAWYRLALAAVLLVSLMAT